MLKHHKNMCVNKGTVHHNVKWGLSQACWISLNLWNKGYIRTLDLVSGSRSPTRPPPTSTEEARRMGMALVMPTKEPKIRFPSTAANLHKALQKPNPVPLKLEILHKKRVEKTGISDLTLIFNELWEAFLDVLAYLCMHTFLPSVCRIELHCHNVQRVPGRDT